MIDEVTDNRQTIQDEAHAWFVRLRSDQVTEADKRLFSNWLNNNQIHEQAFDEVMDAWETMGAISYLHYDLPEFSTSQSTDSNKEDRRTSLFPGASFWQGRINWAMGAVMAGVLAVVLANFTLLSPSNTNELVQALTYTTAIGEQRQVLLSDGSSVDLNTNSRLAVAYDEEIRRLELVQGEAYFKVAHDAQRPFVVELSQGTVTALGTQFNIYRQDRSTLITVTEGLVRVSEKQETANPTPLSHEVKANQQISFDKYGLSEVGTSPNSNSTAWLRQTLIFDNIELTDALSELNRYLETPVVPRDESLQGLKVSGTFSLTSPEATLQALVASFDLVTESSLPEDVLYLRAE